MAFDELYTVSTRVTPVDQAATGQLLADFGIEEPGGYQEFLIRFGVGEVCGFLRVLSPEEVRERWREIGGIMDDEWLFQSDAELWARWGVTFDQFRRGVELWSTNQRPSFVAFPGHGPRVFHWEIGDVACYERGMIDVVPGVARLMFDMSFPYFEPRHPSRKRNDFEPRPGLDVDRFAAAVSERWGTGVRRLVSGQDDYVVNVFARPVQARFACYREEAQAPEQLTDIAVTYDAECESELRDFLGPFVTELGG